jgi:hypothetical protein
VLGRRLSTLSTLSFGAVLLVLSAVLPGCRSTDASYCDLAGVPLWAFHGADDSVVDPRGSMQTVQRLRRCTPPPTPDPRLTVFPGVGHDSWSPTYSGRGRDRPHDLNFDAYDRNLYDWMLQFPREEKP